QLSYWGATVGANIAKSVPVVGESLRGLLLGGETYGKATLPRFYVLHAAVLPAAIIVLVMLHIAIIRVQGVSELRFEDEPAEEKKHFNFIPDHLFTEIIMGLVLMVVLTTLAIVFPAELGPKANPLVTPEVIKPEWFFYVAFRWLKLFSGTVALLSMGFIIFAMFAWPFIDAWIRKHTKFREASVLVGALAALAIMGLTVWEAVVAH
ncbi:MAG: cytochrome bc complex cytochrome b subunit, partial [Myxococcales bacterium]|nr:cytochrome bc complex cytochrome b subunit [Myxococcales bacterium]